MAEQRDGAALKRRGLMAGAAALVAGIAAQRASQPVGATSGGGPDGPLVMGSNFGSGGSPNTLSRLTVQVPTSTWGGSSASMFGVDAVIVGNAPADTTALYAVGKGGGAGLLGTTGITPTNVTALNAGVYGLGSAGKHGVHGTSSGAEGIGVYGGTEAGGVYGIYGISSSAGGVGVSGNCTGGIGLLGTVSDGYAVLGQAVTGNGIYGFSQQNHAIVGQTARPYFGGVLGVATLDNTVGIYGSTNNGATNNANAYAGYMDGNFVVANGVKSAAVPHADGSHRLVYCVESPESWLEDFGKAKLVGGKADVKLDADFAAVADMSDYHVFLTPDADCKGFFVTGKGAAGFAVRERQGGTSSLSFSYRIVAKRKDIAAERLAKFDLVGKAKAETSVPKAPPKPKAPPAPLTPDVATDRRP
jgi:hypothetical protein